MSEKNGYNIRSFSFENHQLTTSERHIFQVGWLISVYSSSGQLPSWLAKPIALGHTCPVTGEGPPNEIQFNSKNQPVVVFFQLFILFGR